MMPARDVLATLDFETFFDRDYTLKNKLTTEEYVRDPRFETIGVGVRWADRPAVWLEDWEFRDWARRVDWSRVALNAHHAHFDGLVLSHHYGITPGFWFCTQSMGRVLHGTAQSVSLANLAPLYGLGAKGKEINDAKGKRRADFTQRQWEAFGGYCRNDCDLGHGLLHKMAPKLPEQEFWTIDTTVRCFTEPKLRTNREILEQAAEEERQKKADLLKSAGATSEVLSSSGKFAELLRKLDVEPPMKQGKRGPIPAFAQNDPGFQELLEHPREEIRALAEARLAVKSTIVETRAERLMAVSKRGAVPFYLKYSGAHTHRWSGGDKLNVQNFNRGGALRRAIEAPEGHSLVVVDSGQIEARTLPWLAGQTNLIETFRRNDLKTSIYEHTLSERLAELKRPATKEEKKAIVRELAAEGIEEGDFYSDVGGGFFGRKLSKSETPLERQLAKNMVLGLGFGMGWGKFSLELLKGMNGTDPVQFTEADASKFGVDVAAFERRPFGRDGETCGDQVRQLVSRLPYRALLIHCAVADYFVRLYRDRNPRIVGYWGLMGKAIEIMAAGDSTQLGCLKFDGPTITKPSGLVLHYPGLRKRGKDWVYVDGRKTKKIYGGLLVENATQSVARDIVAEQILRVRQAGHHVGTTTHDEGMFIVPDAQARECLSTALREFRKPPAWCADLPLNAEGGIGKNYGGAK
jgi:hypothetical protein